MYKPLCRECFNDETLIKELRDAEMKDEEQLKVSTTENESMVEGLTV